MLSIKCPVLGQRPIEQERKISFNFHFDPAIYSDRVDHNESYRSRHLFLSQRRESLSDVYPFPGYG
jgi:hypothetical protein